MKIFDNIEDRNPYLSTEVFTPIEDRVKHNSEILIGLIRLKDIIGEERYKKHISEIKNINKSENLLLIIANNFFHRSLLEREFITELKTAFNVTRIQIIG